MNHAGQRVLVVEAEAANRAAVERWLTGSGYAVVSAASGPDALRIVKQQGAFDVYVLDALMPRVSGEEVARQIRQHDPHANVLYVAVVAR